MFTECTQRLNHPVKFCKPKAFAAMFVLNQVTPVFPFFKLEAKAKSYNPTCAVRRCIFSSIKAILGFLPSYLLSYINRSNTGTYNLRSQICSCCPSQKSGLNWERKHLGLLLPLPGTCCKKLWNIMSWSHWTLKVKLDDLEVKTSGCRCFAWGRYYCSWPLNVAVLNAKCL